MSYKHEREQVLTAQIVVDYICMKDVEEADAIDALVKERRFNEAFYHEHYGYVMNVMIGKSTELRDTEIVTCEFERAAHEAHMAFFGQRVEEGKLNEIDHKKYEMKLYDYNELRTRAAWLVGEQVIQKPIAKGMITSLADDGTNWGYQFILNRHDTIAEQKILKHQEKLKTLSDNPVTLERLSDDTIAYIYGTKAIVIKATL